MSFTAFYDKTDKTPVTFPSLALAHLVNEAESINTASKIEKISVVLQGIFSSNSFYFVLMKAITSFLVELTQTGLFRCQKWIYKMR